MASTAAPLTCSRANCDYTTNDAAKLVEHHRQSSTNGTRWACPAPADKCGAIFCTPGALGDKAGRPISGHIHDCIEFATWNAVRKWGIKMNKKMLGACRFRATQAIDGAASPAPPEQEPSIYPPDTGHTGPKIWHHPRTKAEAQAFKGHGCSACMVEFATHEEARRHTDEANSNDNHWQCPACDLRCCEKDTLAGHLKKCLALAAWTELNGFSVEHHDHSSIMDRLNQFIESDTEATAVFARPIALKENRVPLGPKFSHP